MKRRMLMLLLLLAMFVSVIYALPPPMAGSASDPYCWDVCSDYCFEVGMWPPNIAWACEDGSCWCVCYGVPPPPPPSGCYPPAK